MKKVVSVAALACVVVMGNGMAAHATTQEISVSPQDLRTHKTLVQKADAKAVVGDKGQQKQPRSTRNIRVSAAAVGSNEMTGEYSYRPGVILVTPDAYKKLPLGHAAMIYSRQNVVESVASGVILGPNNWMTSKDKAYQVVVTSTSEQQDQAAVTWASKQIGKPYNFNYLNTKTRSEFYCSHLVWAAYKDTAGVDLNTSLFAGAIHPMELVWNSKTSMIWRKA